MLSDWKSAYLWRRFFSLFGSCRFYCHAINGFTSEHTYIERQIFAITKWWYDFIFYLHLNASSEHGGSEIDGKEALVIYAAKLLIKIHPLFRISFHPYDTLKGSLNANRRRHNGIKEGLKHPHLTERWFLWVVESERGAKKGIFYHPYIRWWWWWWRVWNPLLAQQIALFVENFLFISIFVLLICLPTIC